MSSLSSKPFFDDLAVLITGRNASIKLWTVDVTYLLDRVKTTSVKRDFTESCRKINRS